MSASVLKFLEKARTYFAFIELRKMGTFFFALPAIMWQVLFLYVPIAAIITMSVINKVAPGAWYSLTWQHYHEILNPLFLNIMWRSLLLALCTSMLCMTFAYPVAYFLALRATTWKNTLLLLLFLPFWTNFLIQVYAWFFILERNGFLNRVLLKVGLITEPLQIMNTPSAIYIVMFFCYLPFMIMPIYTSLEKINRRLFEASYDLGATPWQTFKRVIFPLSMSGVKTGFFLVFIPTFGEYVIPAMLGGGKTFYVGSLLSYFFIDSPNMHLGSSFTVVSGFVLIVAVVFITIMFKWLMRLARG